MANCFWFHSILAGWSTWQWVFLNFSQNFWSFDTLTPLGVHPQWFEITWNRYERFLLLCMWEMKDILLTSALQWVTFLNKNSAHKIWAKKDNEIKVSFHHCSKNPYIFISSYTSFSNSWLCQKTQIASRDAKPLMYLYLLRVDIA